MDHVPSPDHKRDREVDTLVEISNKRSRVETLLPAGMSPAIDVRKEVNVAADDPFATLLADMLALPDLTTKRIPPSDKTVPSHLSSGSSYSLPVASSLHISTSPISSSPISSDIMIPPAPGRSISHTYPRPSSQAVKSSPSNAHSKNSADLLSMPRLPPSAVTPAISTSSQLDTETAAPFLPRTELAVEMSTTNRPTVPQIQQAFNKRYGRKIIAEAIERGLDTPKKNTVQGVIEEPVEYRPKKEKELANRKLVNDTGLNVVFEGSSRARNDAGTEENNSGAQEIKRGEGKKIVKELFPEKLKQQKQTHNPINEGHSSKDTDLARKNVKQSGDLSLEKPAQTTDNTITVREELRDNFRKKAEEMQMKHVDGVQQRKHITTDGSVHRTTLEDASSKSLSVLRVGTSALESDKARDPRLEREEKRKSLPHLTENGDAIQLRNNKTELLGDRNPSANEVDLVHELQYNGSHPQANGNDGNATFTTRTSPILEKQLQALLTNPEKESSIATQLSKLLLALYEKQYSLQKSNELLLAKIVALERDKSASPAAIPATRDQPGTSTIKLNEKVNNFLEGLDEALRPEVQEDSTIPEDPDILDRRGSVSSDIEPSRSKRKVPPQIMDSSVFSSSEPLPPGSNPSSQGSKTSSPKNIEVIREQRRDSLQRKSQKIDVISETSQRMQVEKKMHFGPTNKSSLRGRNGSIIDLSKYCTSISLSNEAHPKSFSLAMNQYEGASHRVLPLSKDGHLRVFDGVTKQLIPGGALRKMQWSNSYAAHGGWIGKDTLALLHYRPQWEPRGEQLSIVDIVPNGKGVQLEPQRLLGFPHGQDIRVTAFAAIPISLDSKAKLFATGDDYGKAFFWDIRPESMYNQQKVEPLHKLQHTGRVAALTYHIENNWLCSVGPNFNAIDLQTGDLVRSNVPLGTSKNDKVIGISPKDGDKNLCMVTYMDWIKPIALMDYRLPDSRTIVANFSRSNLIRQSRSRMIWNLSGAWTPQNSSSFAFSENNGNVSIWDIRGNPKNHLTITVAPRDQMVVSTKFSGNNMVTLTDRAITWTNISDLLYVS